MSSCQDPSSGRAVGRALWWVLALVSLGLLGLLPIACRSWFYPPTVESLERHAPVGTASFDHSKFDAVLRAHVRDGGFVDYDALQAAPGQLDAYIAELATAPFAELGRDAKLALLINAYNAFTLRLILDHLPLASIRDIPSSERWAAQRFTLAGEVVSLEQLEHERIRREFAEPRIHFALVCAAVGCPPLRAEAYDANRLEAQLADQAAVVHSNPRWWRFVPAERTLHLTRLYDWYRSDFEQAAGGVLEYASRFSTELAAALAAGDPPQIEWLDYDWSLNSLAAAEAAVGNLGR